MIEPLLFFCALDLWMLIVFRASRFSISDRGATRMWCNSGKSSLCEKVLNKIMISGNAGWKQYKGVFQFPQIENKLTSVCSFSIVCGKNLPRHRFIQEQRTIKAIVFYPGCIIVLRIKLCVISFISRTSSIVWIVVESAMWIRPRLCQCGAQITTYCPVWGWIY